MQPISKPWWEQVTALISLSVSGAVTGFSFVPKAPADLRSPSSMPIQLLAMEQTAQAAPADDTALRSAIVNVANYFLRMAATKTPAEMEAIIWHHDSIDGVDHGESCAAFASLTLEMAAHVVGQQSWVTGGTTYPWPLHEWADVRVDPTRPPSTSRRSSETTDMASPGGAVLRFRAGQYRAARRAGRQASDARAVRPSGHGRRPGRRTHGPDRR